MIQTINKQHGFSLIELVIALVILSVGILATTGLTASSIWRTQRANDLTNTAIAAQRILDDLSTRPFDSIPEGGHLDTVDVGQQDFIVRWRVSDVTDSVGSGAVGIKRIESYAAGGTTQTTGAPFELYIFDSGGA